MGGNQGGLDHIWQMYDCLILLLTLLATALCQDGREGRKGRREEERHEGKRWKDIGTHLTYSLKRCICKTKPQHLINLCGGNHAKYTYHPMSSFILETFTHWENQEDADGHVEVRSGKWGLATTVPLQVSMYSSLFGFPTCRIPRQILLNY